MNEIEDLKNKTSYIEHREKRIYLIIDIQLIIIIVIIPVIIFLYKRKKVKKINSEYSGYRNLISWYSYNPIRIILIFLCIKNSIYNQKIIIK